MAALTASAWRTRTERLLEQALSEVRAGNEAGGLIQLALLADRIDGGDLSLVGEFDGFEFPGEEEEPACICPLELLERGGYRGGCLQHAAIPGGAE